MKVIAKQWALSRHKRPELLRAWRKAKGMTQEKAARHFDVTLRTVQHWEAGTAAPPEELGGRL